MRGRKKKEEGLQRQHCVSSRFNPDELARLDEARGQMQRGEYLRNAAFGQLPEPIPAINLEAWQVLSKVAGNLATLATAMRGGEYVPLDDIQHAVDALRLSLISSSPAIEPSVEAVAALSATDGMRTAPVASSFTTDVSTEGQK